MQLGGGVECGGALGRKHRGSVEDQLPHCKRSKGAMMVRTRNGMGGGHMDS